jgi:hypothetical protein
VKAALTRAYKEGSKSRMVRAADLISLPGMKKAPKKRIAAILEPSDDGLVDGSGETLAENEEENSSDTEELGKPLHLTQLTCNFKAPYYDVREQIHHVKIHNIKMLFILMI